MKFEKIRIQNFKPYSSLVEIDLTTTEEKNVILIGGRNGQGKTSLLVSIVWCLYGANMVKVDDIFRKEIKGSYSKWLNTALNRNAKSKGKTELEVQLVLKDVNLSEAYSIKPTSSLTLIRKVSFTEGVFENEIFDILFDDDVSDLLSDDEDKANFVNDYIIPIDVAKFVFFDAEKISEIAALDVRSRAALMDKSFGQILGLNLYEELIQDLQKYKNDLKRREVSSNVEFQIASFEAELKANEAKIRDLHKSIDESNQLIDFKRQEINDITNQLIRRGGSPAEIDLDKIRSNEQELQQNFNAVSESFISESDFIALSILAPNLELVIDQVRGELNEKLESDAIEIFEAKTKNFVEDLFNRPLYPEDDIDMAQKMFYYQKAQLLLNTHFKEKEDRDSTYSFEYGISRNEFKHLEKVYSLISQKSKNSYENLFNRYLRIQNELAEVRKEIRYYENQDTDEFTADLTEEKAALEKELEVEIKKTGESEQHIESLEFKNQQLKSNISKLLDRVGVSKVIEDKVTETENIIRALNLFVLSQKDSKREVLQKTMLSELKKLIHKKELIGTVRMEFIKGKSNYGLDVKLFNVFGGETNPSTDMSKGEQQLYVSSLLKTILSESVHSLPVFIDTPLGRLDQEHRDSILQGYYPELSEQVVIFSTNTEIRVEDLPKIKNHISSVYSLHNTEDSVEILNSYFDEQI